MKEQFHLMNKFLTETNNQHEPHRNKEFIELPQQQIQILVENQRNLSKVDFEPNSTREFKTVTQKSNRNLSIQKTALRKIP